MFAKRIVKAVRLNKCDLPFTSSTLSTSTDSARRSVRGVMNECANTHSQHLCAQPFLSLNRLDLSHIYSSYCVSVKRSCVDLEWSESTVVCVTGEYRDDDARDT